MKEPKLRFKADDGAKFPDWGKNNFSDVFDSINNSTFSRDCLNYVDGNVKYIHYGDILTTFDSTVNVEASNVPYVNKDIDCQKYQLLADGDIIVADTAEDDTVGKAVEIVNVSNVKVISGLHTIACRPKLKFTSGYLGYYMNSNSYHNQLHPYMQGIKVTSISKANIALTNISIPSLPEQQKIASLFTELDILIQSAEKELEGYRELKQGMLQKMFPKKGELVPEIRFPEFSGEWKKYELGDVLNDMYNGQTPSRSKPNYWNGDVKWLSSGELNRQTVYDSIESITEEGRKSANLRIIPKGTFVMAITGLEAAGTRGNCALLGFNTTLNQSCMALFPNENLLTTKFLFQWYKNVGEEYGITYTQGTKQRSYNAQLLEILPISLPTIKEQNKITCLLEEIDNLIASQQQELDGYKELKKGLLQQMFC